MKSCLVLIVFCFSLFGNTLEAREVVSSRKIAPVSFLSESLPDDDYLGWGWSYAAWSLPDKNILTAEYQCDVEMFLDFWPSIKSCHGAFVSSVSGEKKPFFLSRESENYHEDLFRHVLTNGPYISFGNKAYELSRFDEVTNDAINRYKGRVQSNIQQERGVVFLVAALIFLFTWYSVVFIKKIFPIVRDRISGVDKKILDIPRKVKSLHDQHIFRSAVIDESARELTRKTFDEAGGKNQVVIQKAIIQALENGDKELAEALKSALKK
ncbi:MAG: hypothetical protein WAO82_04485 [Limnohabitans sp.]